MKGQLLSFPIVLTIVTLVVVIVLLSPIKLLTKPLVRVVKYEEGYDNVHMTLISLLSSTEDARHGTKTVQQKIGEDFVIPGEYLDSLEDKLDDLVESGCYKLSIASEELAKKCNPKEYERETKIVLPYHPNELTETLNLVID